MSSYRVVTIAPPRWSDSADVLDALLSPSRIFQQRFGLGLSEDDVSPMSLLQSNYIRQRQLHNRQATGLSEVKYGDERNFQVNLDVNQFSPNELTVKTVDNCVVVHGKHEERLDEHGFISREFTRRYDLPEDVEPEKIVSSLSRDGVLTIEAPKKALEMPATNERIVPIIQLKAPVVDENNA